MVKKMQDVRDEEVFVIRGWRTDSGSVVGFCFGSSKEHQRPKAEVDPCLSSLLKSFLPVFASRPSFNSTSHCSVRRKADELAVIYTDSVPGLA
jgi:hypothetical protein